MPTRDGLITVQIGGPGTASVTGNEQALRALLNTAGGVAILSATGRAEGISIDVLDARSNLVAVRFRDASVPAFDGLEPVEWRAFLDLGDRLATVTVRGFLRAPLDADAGRLLLEEAVAALRAANAGPAAVGT